MIQFFKMRLLIVRYLPVDTIYSSPEFLHSQHFNTKGKSNGLDLESLT